MANPLKTQADGSEFAIRLFTEIASDAVDSGGLCPYNYYAATDPDVTDEDFKLYREGPQFAGIYDALEMFYAKASTEARKGFASLVTDLACNNGIASDALDLIINDEAKGRHQDFGQPGSAWAYKARDPQYADPTDPGSATGHVSLIRVGEAQEPELVTEADGRMFAIDALEECERHGEGLGSDAVTLAPFNPDTSDPSSPPVYYRTRPQWDGFAKRFETISTKGTAAARRGFAAVLTEQLASESALCAASIQKNENAGINQDMGTRGDALPLPVGTVDRKFKLFLTAATGAASKGSEHD